MGKIPAVGVLRWTGIGLGISWFVFMVILGFDDFRDRGSLMSIGAMLTFLSPCWISALYCLYFGLKLQNCVSYANIRRTAGGMTVLVAVVVLSFTTYLRSLGENHAPHMLSSWVIFLVITGAATAFFAVTCRAVMKREGIPTKGYREFAPKPILALIAYEILIIGVALFNSYEAPSRNGPYAPSPTEFLGIIPFLAAYAFYRVSAWYVDRGKPERPNATTGAS